MCSLGKGVITVCSLGKGVITVGLSLCSLGVRSPPSPQEVS